MGWGRNSALGCVDVGAWAVLFADTLPLRVVGSGTKRPAPVNRVWALRTGHSSRSANRTATLPAILYSLTWSFASIHL